MRVKALKRLNVDGVHVEKDEEVTLSAERGKAAIDAGIAVEVGTGKKYETKEEKKFE